MRIAAHQPALLPWAGFWHKYLSADLFVLMPGVAWAKDGFLNRIRHDGAWLTMPVAVGNDDPIHAARIAADMRRVRKVDETVHRIGGRYVDRLTGIRRLLHGAEPGDRLSALNEALIDAVATELHADTRRVTAIDDSPGLSKTAHLRRLLALGIASVPDLALDAGEEDDTRWTYLTGLGGREYIEPHQLVGMPIAWQDVSSFDRERSILTVLAQEPDPVDYVMSRGRWIE